MIGLDTLLWWTCKGTVILGGAAIATFALRRRPAAVRHAVWTIAVGAQLFVPLAPHFLPAGALGVAMPPVAKTALESWRSAPTSPDVQLPFPASTGLGARVPWPAKVHAPTPSTLSFDGA